MSRIIKPQLTPMMEFLLACLSKEHSESKMDFGVFVNQSSFDWNTFIKLVQRHRVFPEVYGYLKNCPPLKVPENIYQTIKGRFERNLQHALKLSAELVRLCKLFEESNIWVLSLKGPPLALELNGNLGLRHAGDIDLLIDKSNIRMSDQLLQEKGYQCLYENIFQSQKRVDRFIKTYHHFTYHHLEYKITLDLHWRLFANPLFLPLDLQQIGNKLRSVTIAETEVKTLPNELNFLYLCAHGSHHNWFRLFWLNDISKILHNKPSLITTNLVELSSRLNARRSLILGCVLANKLLGATVPDFVFSIAEKNNVVCRLTNSTIRDLIQPTNKLDQSGLDRIKNSWNETLLSKKLKFKIGTLYSFSISPLDFQIMNIPDKLFLFYYLLRPFSILLSLLSVKKYFVPSGNKDINAKNCK